MAAGVVLVGFCKLRGKHMSDTTRNKELCKDRATVDIPANAKPVAMKPEPSLYTDKEKEQLSRAAQKTAQQPASSSPTFADLAAKQTTSPSYDSRNTKTNSSARTAASSPKAEVSRMSRQPEKKAAKSISQQKPAEPPRPQQVVPPLKMTPQEAIKLLDQQLSGKINVRFTKYGTQEKSEEKEVIRRAVWGGGT